MSRHRPAHHRPPTHRLSRWRAGLLTALAVLSIGAAGATTIVPAQAATACAPYVFANSAGLALNTCSAVTQLTADHGDEPAIAPDGHAVAYRVPTSPDTTEIATVPLTGGSPVQVTHLRIKSTHPTWSPDSTQLAFSVLQPGATDWLIDRVPANGSAAPQWMSIGWNPTWCHDGNLAMVQSNGTGSSSIAVGMNGLNPILVTPNGTNDDPTWSPDCKWVFYDHTTNVVGSGTTASIYVSPATGGAATQLTNVAGALDLQPSVSGGWTLGFGRSLGTSAQQLYLQALGGSDATAQTAPGSGTSWLAFQPGDGSIPPPAAFLAIVGASPSPSPSASSPSPSRSPSVTPTAACPVLKFFGVRGSGEHSGYGSTIGSVKDKLTSLVPGLSPTTIDYPAVDVNLIDPTSYVGNYVNSVFAGTATLEKALRAFIAQCPHTYVVLAGYSQGVDVVCMVYIERLTDGDRKHIAAVLTFGDPEFNPKQALVDYGDFNAKLVGILVKLLSEDLRKYPGKWANRVASYCTDGDPVCGYSKTNLVPCNPLTINSLCPHTQYVKRGWTSKSATWAYDSWSRLPKLR